MQKASELRKKAARARRLATVRTVGGHEADLHLFALATQLEKLADEAESRAPNARSDLQRTA